jgi:hypothetical protein
MSGSDFLHFVQFYMLCMTSLNQYMSHMQINAAVFQLMTSSFQQQRSQLSVCLVEMKSSFAYHFQNLTCMSHTCMMQSFQCLIWCCGFGLTSCDSDIYVLVLVHRNDFMNIYVVKYFHWQLYMVQVLVSINILAGISIIF